MAFHPCAWSENVLNYYVLRRAWDAPGIYFAMPVFIVKPKR
jgi:hypothetical protein